MSTTRRVRLSLVIDGVAALRQRRLVRHPEPLAIALLAEQSGADGVTLRLRTDRAEIQDRDVELVVGAIGGHVNLRIGASDELLDIAARLRPARCCLVPERRHDHAPGGALDALRLRDEIAVAAQRLRDAGIEAAARIDPDGEQIDTCAAAGLDAIELNCAAYSLATESAALDKRLAGLSAAARQAASAGLKVYAGGGLDYRNVASVAALTAITELRIGHAILAHAIATGLGASIAQMRCLLAGDGRHE